MIKNSNIIFAEPSSIISEGLGSILNKKPGFSVKAIHATQLDELQHLYARWNPRVIIINPSLIQNNIKLYQSLRNQFVGTYWVGLVYAYYEPQLLSSFDARITISDSPELIVNTIQELLVPGKQQSQNLSQDILSERETDVLKLLATGMSNKEIADKLNISVNTVITHRKNISQKTGIKSVSGLTIYAVVQKIIPLDELTE